MTLSRQAELSHHVWQTRYRDPDVRIAETTIEATWNRVAQAVAAMERNPALWHERFLSILRGYRFLPGGRILAGAGAERTVTLANCFVMGTIEDSMAGIFDALKEGALTIQQGGGVGYDFSTLRPRGTVARTTGMIASGPVSFMRVWDAMCATLMSSSVRQGAMMASLRCDHPDIEAFIDAKRAPDTLSHFNLSVQVTEDFMHAVLNDLPWPLVFPAEDGTVERVWTGGSTPVRCKVHRTVSAKALWRRLCDSAYDCAEPGILFVDRVNADNNLHYCERLTTTNPCAEAPLPPYGACHLGSINVAAFVQKPFSETAEIDEEALSDTTRVAVRFLDDVIDLSRYPLPHQQERAHDTRRMGLGITGLADALAMLRLRYDSEPARAAAARIVSVIRDAAYSASVDLAAERGAFPAFVAESYLQSPFIRALPTAIRDGIARHGIRNSHLLAIAPAGAISLLAGNVSSGIEPIFGIETLRHVQGADGAHRNFQVTDHAYALWRQFQGAQAHKPDYFVEAESIPPRDHLLMLAALTPLIDGAISKTIALPRHFPRSEVAEIYETAHVLGLKGCTVFCVAARAASSARVMTPDAAQRSALEYCSTSGRSVE